MIDNSTGRLIGVLSGDSSQSADYTAIDSNVISWLKSKDRLAWKRHNKPAAVQTEWIDGSKDPIGTMLNIWSRNPYRGVAWLTFAGDWQSGILAAYQASLDQGGVLQTFDENKLDPRIIKVLRNNHTTKVHVFGSKENVSENIERQLNAAGIKTDRMDTTDMIPIMRQINERAVAKNQVSNKYIGKTTVINMDSLSDSIMALNELKHFGGKMIIASSRQDSTWLFEHENTGYQFIGGGMAKAVGEPGTGINQYCYGFDRYQTAYQETRELSSLREVYAFNGVSKGSAALMLAAAGQPNVGFYVINPKDPVVPAQIKKMHLVGSSLNPQKIRVQN